MNLKWLKREAKFSWDEALTNAILTEPILENNSEEEEKERIKNLTNVVKG